MKNIYYLFLFNVLSMSLYAGTVRMYESVSMDLPREFFAITFKVISKGYSSAEEAQKNNQAAIEMLESLLERLREKFNNGDNKTVSSFSYSQVTKNAGDSFELSNEIIHKIYDVDNFAAIYRSIEAEMTFVENENDWSENSPISFSTITEVTGDIDEKTRRSFSRFLQYVAINRTRDRFVEKYQKDPGDYIVEVDGEKVDFSYLALDLEVKKVLPEEDFQEFLNSSNTLFLVMPFTFHVPGVEDHSEIEPKKLSPVTMEGFIEWKNSLQY